MPSSIADLVHKLTMPLGKGGAIKNHISGVGAPVAYKAWYAG